jgi:hypothetical protein
MTMRRPRADVALIVVYLAIGLPLQVWAMLEGPLPRLNYGHGWASIVTYGLGAPCAAYLLARRRPRARSAVYILLTFDAVRSLRLGHGLPLGVDVAIILYLQTAPMRRLYPSMLTRARVWRRRLSARPSKETG